MAVVLGSAPYAAAGSATYRLWHWNIAGNALHHGSVSDGLIDALTASVRHRDADLVSLNEVCHGQYEAVLKRLRHLGWPADRTNFARFTPTLGPREGLCRGSEAYGVALFSKRPLGPAATYVLPSDGAVERRVLLCAPLAARPKVTFCTTHLTPMSAYNKRQITALRTHLDAFAHAGRSYMVAGDFNAQPHQERMEQLYAPSANSPADQGDRGAHRELDDADARHCMGRGERTFTVPAASLGPCGSGVKLDHLLVRAAQISGAYSADALALPTSCSGMRYCSDHHALIGTVSLRSGR
ncbi:endonuclease/exonuclease/phosphatase family protein [Streptomyces sp. SID8379]|uniref:endonuclease/exonuclease/phosphatase family protein n=1 Tax=unclassified Streptomyces TaxID=2593676 RepID=UPI0004777D45|nr:MULTISPECIES: endonuclease/exonuclease/phosphatase family protein [unclassified Streptomyces]MYW64087.1 endonuclease/exonuclease/phosphatase family protein [Streptomyces sp. SID8379]